MISSLSAVPTQDPLPRGAQPFEPRVEGFVPSLDQSVRVQEDRRSRRHRHLPLDERGRLRQAEWRVRARVGGERGSLRADDERWRVAGRDVPERAQVLREQADQERHQLALAEVTMELIGPGEDVQRRAAHQRVRAEGVPHLPHQRRRRQTVTRHVADHEDDVAPGQDERVEPVAAHTDGGGGRQVPRRHAQPRQEREDLREERPLERFDHDAGTVREAGVERERDPVGDELEELGLVGREAPRDFVPTCITPTTSPSAINGTPRRDLIPFWNRIGFRTVL